MAVQHLLDEQLEAAPAGEARVRLGLEAARVQCRDQPKGAEACATETSCEKEAGRSASLHIHSELMKALMFREDVPNRVCLPLHTVTYYA